jgi:hypothetical protein
MPPSRNFHGLWSACIFTPAPLSARCATNCLANSLTDVGGAIFCFLMTDPGEYGVPSPLVIVFYNLSGNMTVLVMILLLFAWAELIADDSLTVSPNGWLNIYKRPYIVFCALRLATQLVLGSVSSANPNNSYRVTHRLWLLDWSWLLFAVFIATLVLTTKLINLLKARNAQKAVVSRVCRRFCKSHTVESKNCHLFYLLCRFADSGFCWPALPYLPSPRL